MTKIIQLSEDIVNKIAAGEVIERPSSVVKELLENSIDSGATSIVVELKKAGKELIRIQDNGCGMGKEDAKLSIERHATSKIRSADDLHNIRTLGFRGEALSSISAVSHFVLTTKEKDSLSGFTMTIFGGALQKEQEVGSPDGTTVEVHDLFLNTPVRKNFLNSDANELKHIVDVVSRYALLYPKIMFKLVHNDKVVLQSQQTKDLLQNIATIYGNDVAKDLLYVESNSESINISGYVSKPTLNRHNKDGQSIFVNGRYIKSGLISKAIQEAYHSVLFVHRYPLAILMIDIDPKIVDVNVHPTKREVKFERGDVLYRFVYHAVRNVLEKQNLIPQTAPKEVTTNLSHFQSPPKYVFEPSTQTVLSGPVGVTSVDQKKSEPEHVLIQSSKLPPFKLLGQIHKTFFVAETTDGLLIIDQHIVQERVLYEKYMRQYLENSVKTQSLLQPEVIEVSPQETILLEKHLDQLLNLGFAIEHFGGNSFLVRSIPFVFGKAQPKELLLELIQQLQDNDKTSLEKKAEEVITRMSCRYSVKAGDTLTVFHLQSLLKELDSCTLPYHCPHGRPIFIKISVDELDKMFMRK